MVVNDLNGVSKEDPIEPNWRKLEPICTENQNYALFDKTWQKLGPKRYFNLFLYFLII